MSYILDALRRSQAERERAEVPGLNAQPVLAAPVVGPRENAAVLWPWLALGVGACGVAALAVWLLRAPAPALAPAPASLPAPAVATAPPPAPPTVMPPAAAPPTLPLVVSAPAILPAAPTVAAPPARSAASAPTTAPVAGRGGPSAPAAAAAPRPIPLAELSPEQRRELPPMALGGSVWSENAASRFVIVNGQVVREGEAAAPGVVLERIAPKAAVMRWRELRIELAF